MFDQIDHRTMNPHLIITHRLRTRRRQLGLTQEQVVSRLAQRGILITDKALSGFEHGTGVDVTRLPELAVALDCTVTYLLGLTADPRSWQPDPAALPKLTAPHRSTNR